MPAHLCHIFPCFDPGGPEIRTAQLISALGDTFRHTVLSLDGTFGCQNWILNRKSVHFLEGPRWKGRAVSPITLARLLRLLNPDMVLTYNWGAIYGILGARLGGIQRVIHAEDGFGPEEIHHQKTRRILARRLILRAATRIVLPSLGLIRIATRVWRLPSRLLRHIPNGVDSARFSPVPAEEQAAMRMRAGYRANDLVIGTVGQLRGEKNHERLIRAFSTVAARRAAKLLVVGTGPLRGQLGSIVDGLGVTDRVVFAGPVLDPADYYRCMDVFALSSDTEQMPIAVLEAMSAEKPIVSTDVGDVKAMVSEANRPYIVPMEKEVLFAEALDRLLDDRQERSRLGRANRVKCEQEYGMEIMLEAYRGLYREVLESGSP